MAVKIRLMRVGKKKQPTYRVVVADSRSPRDGRIIETIGHYGPREEPSRVSINSDRALDWLRKGAKPTEQVQKLLTASGVWATFTAERPNPDTKLNRRGHVTGRGPAKNTVKVEKAKVEAPAPVAEAATAAEETDAASDAPAADDAVAEDTGSTGDAADETAEDAAE
ncbi:MAG: 30S ribosomal protein S16 [Actinomycetota bacterium]